MRYLSIHVRDTAQLSVAAGPYGMQVLLGSDWCNLDIGLSDGVKVSVAGSISIHTGSTTLLQFNGFSPHPVRLALAYSLLQPADLQTSEQAYEVIGAGELKL